MVKKWDNFVGIILDTLHKLFTNNESSLEEEQKEEKLNSSLL